MNEIRTLQITSLFAGIGVVTLFGCAYMRFGMVCDQMGNCAPGVVIEGVFCPEGGTAPSEEECTGDIPPDDGPLSPFDIQYSTNWGLSMTSASNLGLVRIYRDEAHQSNVSVHFTTIGNNQIVTDPEQLQSDVEAEMTSSTSTYSFELAPPTINVTTGAPPGALVTLTAVLSSEGLPISSDDMSYVADVGGGPSSTTQEFGGPN